MASAEERHIQTAVEVLECLGANPLSFSQPEGAAPLLRQLAGLAALFVERVDGRRSAQARRRKARSVCAARP